MRFHMARTLLWTTLCKGQVIELRNYARLIRAFEPAELGYNACFGCECWG